MQALRPGPANRGPFVGSPAASDIDQAPALPPDVEHDWAEGHDQTVVASDYQQSDEPPRQLEDAWGWEYDDAGHVDDTLVIAASTEPIGPNEPALVEDAHDYNAEAGYDDPSTDLMAAALGPVIPNAPPNDPIFSDEWDHASDEPVLLGVPDSYQQSDELVENPVRQEAWTDDDPTDDWPAFLDAATGADAIAADAPALAEWDWSDDDPDGWWLALDAAQDPAELALQTEWGWADDAPDEALPDDPIGDDAPPFVSQDEWAWADEPADEPPADEPIGADAPALLQDDPGDDIDPDDWWHALDPAQDSGSPELHGAAEWAWDEVDDWAPEDILLAPDGPADAPLEHVWLDDEAGDDVADDSAPVGADLNLELAPQTEIDWASDEPAPLIVPDSYQQADVALVEIVRADEWDWDAGVDDLLADELVQALLGAAFIVPETDIDWASEELPLLAIGDDYQQTDAPPDVARQGFDDEAFFDPETDDDFFDDFGNEEITTPPLAAEDTWFDSDAFEDVHEGSAPVGPDAPPNPELAPQPDLFDFFAGEVEDDGVDDFGNEDADSLLTQDIWFEAEVADDAPEESGPVGADEIAPLVQEEPDFASDLENDWVEPSEPVGDNAPEQPAIADAPSFDDDAEDPPPLDEYRNENEPDPPVADGWEWQEPPADDDSPWIEGPALVDNEPVPFNEEWSPDEDADPDDWWHADIQHPLVDFVPLPGPVYEEVWDWDVDNNDHDAWWAALTTPDTDGTQVDQCPILLAEAYARIAELEAELAECRRHHGDGGGGGASGDGDDVDHHGHGHGHHNRDHRDDDSEQRDILRERAREEDEKRRRIEAQNAMLMALAGALIHGLKAPKGPDT